MKHAKRTASLFLSALVAALLAGALPAPAAGPAGTQLTQAPSTTQAAYVRGIQKELLAHGYGAGPVDGVAGPRTQAAIRAYQRDAGLTVDGQATKRLLDHLKFALPKVYSFGEPVMGHVLEVQRELAKRGYYLGPHDGIAGAATQRAVSWFQRDAGLAADPAIDSRLLQQIRDADASITADTRF